MLTLSITGVAEGVMLIIWLIVSESMSNAHNKTNVS